MASVGLTIQFCNVYVTSIDLIPYVIMNKTNHANANTNANKKMTLPFAERQTIVVRNHMMSLETISFYDFDSPYEYLENCY